MFSINYVLNKYITVNDKESVWINETIKSKIKAKMYSAKNRVRMKDLKVTYSSRKCNNRT